MPIEVTGPVYTKNTVRITFRTYTWADLQASADEMSVSLLKEQDGELIPVTELQDQVPSPGTIFEETEAGQYVLKLRSATFSAGTYYAVFEGEIDEDEFYEPVEVVFQTLAGVVSAP